MASDETMVNVHSDDFLEDLMDDGSQNSNHQQHKYLSRLSTCKTSHEDEDLGMEMYHNLSRLSIESFDGGADADEELSDEKEEGSKQFLWGISSSDSDKEHGSCSLPATPPRRRRVGRGGGGGGCGGGNINHHLLLMGVKEYASENDVQNGLRLGQRTKKYYPKRRKSNFVKQSNWDDGLSGESEGSVMVITRPKGGRRSLCMDLEEVKACRDLGFELEHQRMLEMPSRVSYSASNLDTSSGGNSPIASMRISSPGDDPRDVKARLKVWAQAVAIASTSKYGN